MKHDETAGKGQEIDNQTNSLHLPLSLSLSAGISRSDREDLSSQQGVTTNHEGDTSTQTDISAQEVPTPKALGRLEAHVRSQLNGRIHDFCLSMREGGLVLEGDTRTYHAKQLAQHAIMEAVQLPILDNAIEVH